MELPQYTIKPIVIRMVVPEFLKMFGLTLLFYFGVKLNFYFLEVKAPGYIDILILAFLALLSAIQVVISNMKISAEQYNFYTNRIERIGGKKPMQIMFADIKNMNIKNNIFDALFGTSKIILEPSMEMNYIKNAKQIYLYIQKLVQNYRYSIYSQYNGGNQQQMPQQQQQMR